MRSFLNLKFQRPLSGPGAILVYDAFNQFQVTIPLTKKMDKELFNNGDLNKTYRRCEIAGDEIITIGPVITELEFNSETKEGGI